SILSSFCVVSRELHSFPTRRSSDLQERQREFALAFEAMPFAIEVATRRGPSGILHADCPVQDWRDLPAALAVQQMREQTIWSRIDRKSTRLNSSHVKISYAVSCLKK